MMDLPAILSAPSLRETASWIRDDLDPLVSREGPGELNPDDVLTVHSVLMALQHYHVSLWTLRFSRIHLAVADICGKATRWPTKLVDEADLVVEHFERAYGRLQDIPVPLFERGGRLYGVCEPEDVTKDALLQRFASCNPSFVDDSRAYIHGSLGFRPGQWWINGMFAFRDGIINSACTDGGICFSGSGAYAIVMTHHDETGASSPVQFTYRCRSTDRGRYRLTAAISKSRYLVRVLRSHTLCSPWSPQVGLRYDGLHRIAGWVCRPIDTAIRRESEDRIELEYDVRLEREESEPFEAAARHPCAEEVDDYRAYRRNCKAQCNAERKRALVLESLQQSDGESHGLPVSYALEDDGYMHPPHATEAGIDAVNPLSHSHLLAASTWPHETISVRNERHDRERTATFNVTPGIKPASTRRNLDGSADEPHRISLPLSNRRASSRASSTGNSALDEQTADVDPMASPQQHRIWRSLFRAVDWGGSGRGG